MESETKDIKLVVEQASSSVPVWRTVQHATQHEATRANTWQRDTTRGEMKLFVALLIVGVANAMPRYIAVPADQIQFIDLAALQAHSRLPRQALSPPPQQFQYEQQPYGIVQDPDASPAASDERPARHAHHDVGDYVDFGAHTGQHGAFGWYADYPVHGHH